MDDYLKILKLIKHLIENGEVVRHDHENKIWQWKDLYVIESTEHKQIFLVNSSDLNVSIPITAIKFNVGNTKQLNREYKRVL